MIKLIAAIDSNRGIGKNGTIPWNLKPDLKRFKELTMDQPVIMGRATADSIPNLLANRVNIIVSHDENYQFITKAKTTIICVRSIDEALEVAHKDCWVIGGQSLYEQTIEMAGGAWITTIKKDFRCDRFFPPLDETIWNLTAYEHHHSRELNCSYEYSVYKR